MTDWTIPIQSVGRSKSWPSMEVKMLTAGKGKYVCLDIETDAWFPVASLLRPHYVELYDPELGQLDWFRLVRKPGFQRAIHAAYTVVRHNEDGSFEYIKNRQSAGLGVLNETDTKEFLFIILKAKDL